MAGGEYSWLDDAFDDSKPDPLEKKRDEGDGEEYDWIDDAFDESKEDPLAKKGMTGCSRLAVLLCSIAVIVVVLLLAFAVSTPLGAVLARSSLQ